MKENTPEWLRESASKLPEHGCASCEHFRPFQTRRPKDGTCLAPLPFYAYGLVDPEISVDAGGEHCETYKAEG